MPTLGVSLALFITGCSRQAQPPAPDPALVQEMNRGVSLMGQYQYDAAVQAFESVLKRSPVLSNARVNLAMALFNRGRKEDRDLDRSTELLQAVLQQEPANVRALYFQGIIWQHIGKTDGAVQCFEKVAKQRPNDGALWYLLAISRQRIGQPAEADLLRAIELKPYLASAYYKLSQTARLAGDTAKATQYLEQFTRVRESPLSETIELPQYNQMGDLALVEPLPARAAPPISKSSLRAQSARALAEWTGDKSPVSRLGGIAIGDLNRDGQLDIVVPGVAGVKLLLSLGDGKFRDATAGSGLETIPGAAQCALGDFDNDERTDLIVAGPGLRLMQGSGDGHFTNVTASARLTVAGEQVRAVFLDADHDSDLDIFVCDAGTASGPRSNQLWNNNGDGTFLDIAAKAGVACAQNRSVAVMPGDLDGDRDMDLVILLEGQPVRIFFNNLLGNYREADAQDSRLRGDLGGVLQDFTGDGALDLLVLGGNPARLGLWLGDNRGHFKPSQTFSESAQSSASWGTIQGFRAADVDLDGDLDVIFFTEQALLLLNDGRGRFVLVNNAWQQQERGALAAAELADFNDDFVPDLLVVRTGGSTQVMLTLTELSPPGTAMGLIPSGVRSRDKRTRSPASGYGVLVTTRAGLTESRHFYAGLHGGPCQSHLPVIAGLAGAPKADYIHLQWPDGVAQAEISLAAGQIHKLSEVQRKVSSCPVLFAWNGERFEFVTDFAGVGGLGYYAAPGVSALPQVLEHVKIEPHQLRARDGGYELRVTEPMEEAAYLDRLELWAIDHPSNTVIFPDEHLAINGPLPTHEWLMVDTPIFPANARGFSGEDCTEHLLQVDRRYAYDPPLDRRFCGFCQPHTLELDFRDRLSGFAATNQVYLFINGFIEYPYSQTVYAAAQSRIGWEPIRLDRQDPDGTWRTIIPDAGAPGGMGRTFTIDLTGHLTGPTCRLRLTTNLELYYDQLFVGRHIGLDHVRRHLLPLTEAQLRRRGFAREYSPDGRLPLIYDYDLTDASAPFHVLRGAYTRYGRVASLLRAYDDQYVVMGPGDEVALTFAAGTAPAPGAGMLRSFILVSHAYCKDMDLYTAMPQTLEPLPFRGMSRYPDPANERQVASEQLRAYRSTWNTRVVE